MKKILAAVLFLAATTTAGAQTNLQFHYDLGHSLSPASLASRPSVTTTIEHFSADRWGTNFFFGDVDYYHDGVAGFYWELSREFFISRNKQFALHLEYDGGESANQLTNYGLRFQHCLLAGPAWNWHSTDFSRTFSLQLLYKQYFKGQHNDAFSSAQATAVWGVNFVRGLFTFSGYIDFWYDDTVDGDIVMGAEPQLWFNISKLKGMNDVKLSLGTEVEVSNNFIYPDNGVNDRFYAIPTIAAKWEF